LFLEVAKTNFTSELWPENITHLFVDGNNLFYLTAGLRMLTIKRNTRETETVLAEITEAFTETKNNLVTTLIFDNSKLPLINKILKNNSTFQTTTARPEYPTSDDALITWARNNPEIAPKSLFITSDKALGVELSLTGAKVVKTGLWMGFVKKTLTGDGGDYNAWLDGWVERFLVKMG